MRTEQTLLSCMLRQTMQETRPGLHVH